MPDPPSLHVDSLVSLRRALAPAGRHRIKDGRDWTSPRSLDLGVDGAWAPALLQILLDVMGPVALIAGIGCLWGYANWKLDTLTFSLVATYVGTPCLVVEALGSSGLKADDLAQIGAGAAISVVAALALGWLVVKASRLDVSTYLPATTFANTGNMGLPLALFAFGQQGLGLAVAYFAVHGVFNFTVGQSLAARRFSLAETLMSPLIWASICGGVLSVTGARLPPILARSIHLLGGLTIPMMLLALGYSLSQLRARSLTWPLVFALVRLFGGFAIGWLTASALGMTGTARGVLIIQSAMPVAVYNYMFAARFNNHPEDVAGLVVLSTVISLAVLPIFLWAVI